MSNIAQSVTEVMDGFRTMLADERVKGRARLEAIGLPAAEIDALMQRCEAMHQAQLDAAVGKIAQSFEDNLGMTPAPGVH
jgi:hypothetical protein